MNSDQWQGKWKQAKGALKAKWGKLTDDDITYINGKRELLIGKLQEHYGLAKEDAQKHADEWIQAFNTASHGSQWRAEPRIRGTSLSWYDGRPSGRAALGCETGVLQLREWPPP